MAAAPQPIRISANPTLAFARPALRIATLITSDVVAFSFSVLCGFFYWAKVNPTIPQQPSAMYLAVAFALAAFAYHGLYPAIGLNAVQQIRLMSRSTTSVYLLLAVSMVLVKDWWASSRGGFFLSWLLALILAPTGRWFVNLVCANCAWWRAPVMILGAGKTARAVIQNLDENQILGYNPVMCLDDDPQKQDFCEGVAVLGPLSSARSFADEFNIRYAIVAMPSMSRAHLMMHMRHWMKIFPHIQIVPDLSEMGSLWVEPHDLGGVLSLELQHHLLNPYNRLLKRTTDLVIAGIGAALALPIVAIAALWIWIVSPGPVFYRQTREGRDGLAIHIFKLRTMVPNADQTLERHLDANPGARAEWEQFCKLKDDPRILPGVGHFLRRTSLDELPQLINILRGDMSLVGPRPFPSYHNNRFHEDFRALRTQVTPGLTGLWQIKARSNGNLEVQSALDSYYVRNWSLWLDFYILIRTVRAVINSSGAY